MLTLPDPNNWRNWEYADYLRYFLSKKAAKRRLKGVVFPLGRLKDQELVDFCSPIRNRILGKYSTDRPEVSITLAAYNEEVELLPTLLSYTLLDCPDGLAELIIVDNNSTDRTDAIIDACGARLVECRKQGLPHARAAGLEAASDCVEYIWMSDADVRVVPPIRREKDLYRMGSALRTSYEYLEKHPVTVGVSTGAVVEASHWLYKVTHNTALVLNLTNQYSCWSGPNQFMRKWALEESGGIHTRMGGSSEDHIRQYQLARWAKENGMHMSSANSNERLADPVYHSGRRVGSAKRVLKSIWYSITRDNLEKGDHWSETKHAGERKWERIRIR